MDNYPESLLSRMLEIYSPSGHEEELSDFLLAELKKMGFNPSRDHVGNVIAESGQGSPTVLLCGHMDTVPGNLEVKLEKGKILGRGAVDAKSSLAAMVMGASKARDEFPGKIVLLGVVDEEGRGTGMRHFIQSNSFDFDYAVLGEPSNTENIVVGYKGLLTLRLECNTKTGHSAAPWRYHSAIDKGIEIWNLIKAGFLDSGEKGSYFDCVTGCLTGINGGNSINVIPSKCELALDVRIPPRINSNQVLNDFRRKIGSYLNDNPSISIDLEVLDRVEGCLTNSDSILAQSFSWAIRRFRKKNPTFLKKTGTSDMNILASKTRIPMIAYGPGDSRLDHTEDEEVVCKDYLDSIKIHVEALKRLATLHSKSSS
jgi:LysW-gamma-L-lysine carboxypeptidase